MTTSDWQRTESDGSTMPVYISAPEGSGPFPGIVVIQHLTGVDEFIQSMTQRLASAGYVAAAPGLYHRDGANCQDEMRARAGRLGDRRVINDIGAAVKLLEGNPAVDRHRLAVIGFCMGGRIVYLTAAAVPEFRAAVTFYPGNTFRAWGRDIPSPFERTEEIHCPIQGHFGAEDKNPSPEDMRKLDGELTKFNKAHEFYSYPNAGHAFMDNTKESYRPVAAEQAWPRALEFLKRHLG